AARALHGVGSALTGVAGLALCAATPHRLPALLGAVALGVLVGYPTGGLLPPAWSFPLLAAALLADLALQYVFLRKEEYNRPMAMRAGVWGAGGRGRGRGRDAATRRGHARAPCC
ncbi:uncharacterized protein, partial [Choristoneura fumiferana]|uniref:uncharacterized protein n=1 Tax=Choristoneura fumiferana TaxID=7141 RepID=UPI003D15D95D